MATEKEFEALMDISFARSKLMMKGWKDIQYCPKDGTIFLAIEFASTGIHKCHYEGKWPDGSFWIHDNDQLYPSTPILWKENL